MVIPPRDWLLLRGRMRAVAKIAALPVLLKAGTPDLDSERPHAPETAEPAAEPGNSSG